MVKLIFLNLDLYACFSVLLCTYNINGVVIAQSLADWEAEGSKLNADKTWEVFL